MVGELPRWGGHRKRTTVCLGSDVLIGVLQGCPGPTLEVS